MAKRRKTRNHKALHGTANTTSAHKKPVMDTLKEGGLLLVSALAGGGAGAAIGKHSLLIGIPVALWGVHKENKYITSTGLGLCLSNGFQQQQSTASTNGIGDEMDGFSVEEVKERVGNYFRNFGEKLYLPKAQPAPQTTNGLGADEAPTYFINPYQTSAPQLQGNDLDLSHLDRVQEQIAQMSGMGEINREF